MVDFNILIKYFAGKADPEEAMLVEEWAAASEDNHAFFSNLHQSWVAAGDEIYTRPDVQQEWEALQAKAPGQVKALEPAKTNWFVRVAGVAAILVVALGGFYLFNTQNQNEPTRIAEATDKALQLKLDDGTQVEVSPDGELVYPVQFKKDSREVTLVGNGSFDVAHMPEKPFIVHLGDLHVRVLGTAFDIERKKEYISVRVKRGKVALYNKTDTIYVAAGEMGKFMKAAKKLVLEQNSHPLLGTFDFQGMPLKEAAAALSAHFNVKIIILNPKLNDLQVGGGFKNQPLKEILDGICAPFNLTNTIEGQTVQISDHDSK